MTTRIVFRSAAACAAAICLGGCGGDGAKRKAVPVPKLPPQIAAALAVRAEQVAAALDAGDSCRGATLARRLQRDTITSINTGRVPPAFQEQLSAAVNDLVAQVACVPPPAPTPVPPPEEEHGKGKHEGHEKKHKEGD